MIVFDYIHVRHMILYEFLKHQTAKIAIKNIL